MFLTTNITKREMKRKMRDGTTTILLRYVLNYRDPKTGQRKQKFFKRQKDAQAAQSRLVREFERGTYTAKKEVPTIAEAFDYWIKDREGEVRPSTLEGYKTYKTYIVGPLLEGSSKQRFETTYSGKRPDGAKYLDMLGHYKIHDLTTADIRQWHKSLSQHVGHYTANKSKQHLGTILMLAAEDFELRPPAIPKRLGRGKQKSKKLILTPAQVKELLKTAREDTEFGIYYGFPFLAGTRPSEQLGLLWEDVDFEQNVISIRRTQERQGGLSEITKTAAGQRHIPMNSLLREWLLEWKNCCPRKDGELHRVFPGPGKRYKYGDQRKNGGGELLYANFRKRVWQPNIEKLGFPPVTPHSARHFFVSMLQAQGVEVGLVAKLAGHANPIVTLGHYSQAVRGGEDAMEKLAEVFQL